MARLERSPVADGVTLLTDKKLTRHRSAVQNDTPDAGPGHEPRIAKYGEVLRDAAGQQPESVPQVLRRARSVERGEDRGATGPDERGERIGRGGGRIPE